MQIKAQWNVTTLILEWVKFKSQMVPSVGKDVEELELLDFAGVM